jgi:hypothetical protein
MEAQAVMQEVRELIAFYDERGWDWISAAEFTLGLRSGMEEQRQHWLRNYILIPRRKALTGQA